MNRRTFIQLTGLTVVSAPAPSFSNEEPQWMVKEI